MGVIFNNVINPGSFFTVQFEWSFQPDWLRGFERESSGWRSPRSPPPDALPQSHSAPNDERQVSCNK